MILRAQRRRHEKLRIELCFADEAVAHERLDPPATTWDFLQHALSIAATLCGIEDEQPPRARHVVMAGGTALFHEGVFEYEVVDGRALAITLLRCVGTISRDRLATRPWPAGPGTPTPNAQMLGDTAFALAVWPNASSGDLFRMWERFALPIVEGRAGGGGDLPPAGSLLDVRGEVELSSVRRVDEALEVSVWNPRTDEPADVVVDGRTTRVGPAGIVRLRL